MIGVCVGMQILFEWSDEDDEPGLGILPGPGAAAARTSACRTWAGTRSRGPGAATRSPPASPTDAFFYFVHSFAPDPGPTRSARPSTARTFAAVVARGNVFATQFHPEKSGEAGLELYANIVREVAA